MKRKYLVIMVAVALGVAFGSAAVLSHLRRSSHTTADPVGAKQHVAVLRYPRCPGSKAFRSVEAEERKAPTPPRPGPGFPGLEPDEPAQPEPVTVLAPDETLSLEEHYAAAIGNVRARANRLVVTHINSLGGRRERGDEKHVIVDPAQIKRVLDMFAATSSVVYAIHIPDPCFGSPHLEFYEDDLLVATLTVHHGFAAMLCDGAFDTLRKRYSVYLEEDGRPRQSVVEWLAGLGLPEYEKIRKRDL